ncbi:MAG: PAS domain S-box protein [Lentisphaerae bacterium]|nr:PAS domain S-box protein [Lentisphaerota bacterium]
MHLIPISQLPSLQRTWEVGAISIAAALAVTLTVVSLLLMRARRAVRRMSAAQSALEEEIRRRQISESALRESEAHFRTLYEHSPIMIDVFDGEGRCLLWNRQCARELGWTQAEVAALPEPWAAFYPDPQVRKRVADSVRNPDGLFRQWQVQAKDGSPRTQLWANFRLSNGHVIATGIDVTDRVKTERALQESERRYRLLFSEMQSGFAVGQVLCSEAGQPGDFRYNHVNDAFERLTGLKRDRIIGRTIREILPTIEPVWIERFGRVAMTGTPERFDDYVQALDRHYEGTAYSPEKGYFAVVFNDVSERRRSEAERRRLEGQMQQAQKLESLGVLAGGIAHDFNNLLMGILGNANLVKDGLPPLSSAHAGLLEIESAAKRAADLCRQMLAYSGKGRFVVEPIDVNATVREIADLLHVSISKKAVLKYHFADNLPAIDADATQIRQVLMNLIINASEAIHDRSGIISVATGAADCTRERLGRACLGAELPAGCYVYVEVSDTGCGMDERTQERMFEPFFTTKVTGRGLGLAAVLGIVRGHKGALELQSAPRRGTTFRVLIPASPRAAQRSMVQAPLPTAWRSTGTILVVDDDETVRTVVRSMLERVGFGVAAAGDGLEAVRVFRDGAQHIDCVVLDLTMPHMDGEETFMELNQLRPGVPIVISSGYPREDIVRRFTGRGIAGVLEKPYEFGALTKTLRDVLLQVRTRPPVGA